MKLKIIKSVVFILFFSGLAFAEETKELKGPAPQGLLNLSYDMSSANKAPVNMGPHGLKRYCYKSDVYIIVSHNLLGKGYEISANKAENLKCSVINNSPIRIKNELGLYIGMPKSDALKLIGVKTIDDSLIMIWSSTKTINDTDFDVQTYVEIQFENDKLDRLSVFTTETN